VLRAARGDCLSSLDRLKEVLLTADELRVDSASEQTKAADAATDVEKHNEDVQSAKSVATLPQSPVNSDTERSRSGSVASDVRLRTGSISTSTKPRRNSSIFVRLPDNMGTSLLRKPTEVPNGTALHTVSEGTDLGAYSSADSQAGTDLYSVTNSGPTATSASSALDETMDISMDLNVSRYHALNDSTASVVSAMSPPATVGEKGSSTSDASQVAIFEHFVVVGASEEVSLIWRDLFSCLVSW
jgi:hypothetical protein